MIIRQIFPVDYQDNLIIDYSYTSNHYYETQIKYLQDNWDVSFRLKQFDNEFSYKEKVVFFNDFKKPAQYYIAEDDEKKIIGWMCIGKIEWKETARLWDLYVKEEFQNKGVGSKLLKFAENIAKDMMCRALEIETQTSNSKAIKFYNKNGYKLSGFDSICYSNKDIEKNEVRIELVKKF